MAGRYVQPDDVYREGVDSKATSEERLIQLIEDAEAFFDNETGRWFEQRIGVSLLFDGTGEDTLEFSVPMIGNPTKMEVADPAGRGDLIPSIPYVFIEVPLVEFVFFNRFGTGEQDDRDDPHILWPAHVFPEGEENVRITGDFGYVDGKDDVYNPTTFETPSRVKRAIIRLVLRDLPLLTDEEAQEDRKRGFVKSERVDRHAVVFDSSMFDPAPITGDTYVDQTIRRYRIPPSARAV